MRRVILSNMISLDGFYAREDDGIDWFVVDEDFFVFAAQQLVEVDTLVFGRRTYESMKEYWATDLSSGDDPRIRDKMNDLPKIVFTHTLDAADWHNTRLAKGDISEEIAALKAEEGKDIVIFGSGQLVSALAERGLIDEYRIMAAPVILGRGKRMFDTLTHDIKLKLASIQMFRLGSTLSIYIPEQTKD